MRFLGLTKFMHGICCILGERTLFRVIFIGKYTSCVKVNKNRDLEDKVAILLLKKFY